MPLTASLSKLLPPAFLLVAACGQPADPVSVDQPLRTSATLVVAPNPVLAGRAIRITGCGYAPDLSVYGEDSSPAGTEYWGTVADSQGCIAVDRNASLHPGDHTLKAFQALRRGRKTLMARTSLVVEPAPLSVVSESYVFQWDPSKACLSEDDHLDWKATGTLAPGEVFVYAPRYPDCNNARAVVVKLDVEATARLRVSTVVPAGDGLSNDTTQAGSAIAATTAGGVARLCMFPNTTFAAPAGYAITVENVGDTTAENVSVSGRDYNDWNVFYWNDCLGADADRDGWSDSLEHAMAQLLYPTGNYNSGGLPAGTDYLRACGTAQPDDQFDAWPPDFDDDGVVTQADVDRVTAHLGEGNGIPWASISPNSGPEGYWSHVGAWNRFDLDADGWVAAPDVELVRARLGARCGP